MRNFQSNSKTSGEKLVTTERLEMITVKVLPHQNGAKISEGASNAYKGQLGSHSHHSK